MPRASTTIALAQHPSSQHGPQDILAVKTSRLYTTAMVLLNVRLDEEDARKAAALRRAGVPISTVVRDAIRTEYQRRIARPKTLRRASKIVAEILTSLPDPPDLPPHSFDAHDRRAARRHITHNLAPRDRDPADLASFQELEQAAERAHWALDAERAFRDLSRDEVEDWGKAVADLRDRYGRKR